MDIYPIENVKDIMYLFKGYENTMVQSFIQGHIGYGYIDCLDCPYSAQIIVGDFCYFIGVANEGLVKNQTKDLIMIPSSKEWAELIEKTYQKKAVKNVRYATTRDKTLFDYTELQKRVNRLDSKYEIKRIDQDIYKDIMLLKWAENLCSQFQDAQDYVKHGLGFVVMHKGCIVSGVSSYVYYDDGIEIEIDTRDDYQRQGLAIAVASQLILECLDKHIYPYWDAYHKGSLALAEKLGYCFDKEYIVYEVMK